MLLGYGDLVKPLNSGSFGQVELYRVDNERFAVKLCKKKGFHFSIIREISCLLNLQHPNIVSILEVGFEGAHHIYFAMPYADQGDLSFRLRHSIAPSERQSYSLQLLSGVQYYLANGVLHRDLKPTNILIQGETLMICDFGNARVGLVRGEDQTSRVATLWYEAPECLLGDPYSETSELWSVGAVLYFIQTSNHLACENDDRAQLTSLFRKLGASDGSYLSKLLPWTPDLDPRCYVLADFNFEWGPQIRALLGYYPKARPSIEMVLEAHESAYGREDPSPSFTPEVQIPYTFRPPPPAHIPYQDVAIMIDWFDQLSQYAWTYPTRWLVYLHSAYIFQKSLTHPRTGYPLRLWALACWYLSSVYMVRGLVNLDDVAHFGASFGLSKPLIIDATSDLLEALEFDLSWYLPKILEPTLSLPSESVKVYQYKLRMMSTDRMYCSYTDLWI